MSEEEPSSFGSFCFFLRCGNAMVVERETVLEGRFIPGMDLEVPAWGKPCDDEAKVGKAKWGVGVAGLVTVVVTSVGFQRRLPLLGGLLFLAEVEAVIFDSVSSRQCLKLHRAASGWRDH